LLDVGCGDGALSVGLAGLCGRETASDRMVDDVRQGVSDLASASRT
jgi:cyclopropane fatty-acyl-phospholipid synthase-like methyltransferase